MEVFLVRHLEIPSYEKGVCVGQSDVALTETGLANIQPLAETLADLEPEVIITSDLQRCKKLAEAIGSCLNLQIEVNPEWREINFGEWENREWEELRENDPENVKKWIDDYVHVTPPEGESFFQLFERVGNQLMDLTRREKKRIIIVTHSGAIRSALCFALGIPLDRSFSLEISYGAIAGLHYLNDRWSLFRLTNQL
ncbi:Phosphoglycerate mutase [Chloroherpeton thalassium ATCC 35110]|uniref:Alpha-ribazole phosphatase n=1 Tax=Chloroherpeton thalassium (strain ATCC 35110 / GB-78) TaxID=517418 RepID=B3QST7_CHLT3|nr:alpha-ribazole phosphatase [Chloroherpeton thalassium]ACF12580.1 Phosphoglycerate mutase [Chloroherpeton thalassium ATCC 35110]